MGKKKRWVAITADAFDHPIVGTQIPPPSCPADYPWSPFQAWAWMVKEAGFADRSVRILDREISLQRGQLALAERQLCRVTNWGRAAARGFLNRLEREGMIERCAPIEAMAVRKGQIELDLVSPGVSPPPSPPVTVVTICNYERYQRPITADRPGVSPPPSPSHYQETTSSKRTLPSRSGENLSNQESDRETNFGTDKERLPFTEEALADCEAMGFTRQWAVDRYRQRTKGRRIRNPSGYIVKICTDAAAKARGVPESALRATLSKSTTERAAGFAAAMPPQPREATLKSVDRRCRRHGYSVGQVLAAWHASIAGLPMPRNPDGSFDGFASAWLSKQGMH